MTPKLAALAAAVLTALIIGPLSAAAGAWWGKNLGRTLQAGEQAQQSVQQLTTLIGSTSDLVKRANTASSAMRQALATRQKTDTQTTQEMRDALDPTASGRAGCVFGADVMRQLATARDRAADAAASGVRGALPATGGDAGRQP